MVRVFSPPRCRFYPSRPTATFVAGRVVALCVARGASVWRAGAAPCGVCGGWFLLVLQVRVSRARVSRVRSVWAWGPSRGPTACALVGRRCSLWGWRKVVPGGVPPTVVGGICGQALPLPELPAQWEDRWAPPPRCCGRGRVGVGA